MNLTEKSWAKRETARHRDMIRKKRKKRKESDDE